MAKGCKHKARKRKLNMVPVIDQNQKPLMPCSEKRARKMVESRKATPFWKRGIFCVRLNVEPSARDLQPIAVGIDPGSKREGFTVKSEAHTYLNIQANAVTHVREKIETRRVLRRSRRCRKTPYRPSRYNRKGRQLPPSIQARWGWKLRVVNWLTKMFPVAAFVVEDVGARKRRGTRTWNVQFGPIEVGKEWFYAELAKLGHVETKQGWETKELRDLHGLRKTSHKLSKIFAAHCVDSWVLANWFIGGHLKPDNERMLFLEPIQFQRRSLHAQVFQKHAFRRRTGGTISLGVKKGRLALHAKHGLCYVAGNMNGLLTVCNVKTGARISRYVQPVGLRLLAYNSWRVS